MVGCFSALGCGTSGASPAPASYQDAGISDAPPTPSDAGRADAEVPGVPSVKPEGGVTPNDTPPVVVNDSSIIVIAFTNEVGDRIDVLEFVSEDPNLPALKLKNGDTLVAAPDKLPTAPEVLAFVDQLNAVYGAGPIDLHDNHTWTAEAAPNRTGFIRVVFEPAEKKVYEIQGYGPRTMYLMPTQRLQLGSAIPDADAGPSPDGGGGTVGLQGTLDLGNEALADFSNKKIFDADGVTLTLSKATLSNHPTVDTSISLQHRAVDTMVFRLQDRLEATLSIALSVASAYDKDVRATLFASQYTLPPQIVGGIPIAETVRFSVDAHCHLSVSGSASVTMGASVSQDFILGASYEKGEWSNLSSVTEPVFTQIGPDVTSSATASFTCELLPRFTLLFYDLVGPYISITPSTGVKVTANADPNVATLAWELTAGVSGELGVEANRSWPGATLLQSLLGLQDKKVSLFSKQTSLATGNVHF